jgi:hypothetical protein
MHIDTALRLRAEVERVMDLEAAGYSAPDLPESVWSRLVEDTSVERVLTKRKTLSWLSDQAWSLLELAQGLKRPRAQPLIAPTPAGDIQEAISQHLARTASREPEVVAFRHLVLEDRLLESDKVAEWIRGKARSEGATQWIEVALSDKTSIDISKERGVVLSPPVGESRGATLSFKMLKFQESGARWTSSVPVRSGGHLDKLRILSELLTKTYQWQMDQATMFVLTGRIPLVPRITMTLGKSGGRIQLTISPHATPREVADTYRQVRRSLLGAGKRLKPIVGKSALLATFALGKEDSEPWSETEMRWNRQYPNHAYGVGLRSYFQRDVKKALAWLERAADPFPAGASLAAVMGAPPSADTLTDTLRRGRGQKRRIPTDAKKRKR